MTYLSSWKHDGMSQNPSAAMVVYKHFRRDRQRKRGSGRAQYVRDYLDLNDGDDKVKFL